MPCQYAAPRRAAPQEVSELLARITVVGKKSVNKVYDPACGSGSLLLKFAKVLGKDNVRKGFFGQEINLTTYNLARINMFLHDINYEQFDIAHGDTLIEPAHWDDEPFEAIVSNPPYSINWAGDSNPLLINDLRFAPAGVLAPKAKADLAFTMHMLSWLAVNGTAAIVEFPGVLYRSGAEQKIRKYLIDNNYVDAVIQLPPDLFFGTTIQTCILVLKKSKKVQTIDLSSLAHNSGAVPSIRKSELEKVRIPMPPVEVQREIVRVLDLLGGAMSELAMQLDAELEARNRQYSHYGDDLFTFRNVDGVQRVPMTEVGKFIRGRRFTKNDVVDDGIPSIHYGEIYTTYGIAASEAVSHVRKGLAPQLRYAKPGDVVIAAVGETVEDVGKAVAWLGTTDIAIHDDCFMYRSTALNPKFVSYYLRTEALNREKAKYVARAKVKLLSGESLGKLIIPVPTLEQQDRVVEILDRFDVLVNDLNVGLPAEVAARRKQYEYYRDRLLTFKELAA